MNGPDQRPPLGPDRAPERQRGVDSTCQRKTCEFCGLMVCTHYGCHCHAGNCKYAGK